MEPIMTKPKKTTTKPITRNTKARTPSTQAAAAPKTKLRRLEGMLRRAEGATIGQIAKALDWQMHSVRGAISGSLKKKLGLTVIAEKTADGERVYRITG
jgi:ABC-type methionine transport system ATPase subunit